MRHYLILFAILAAGAAILSPVVAAFGLDPMPGDFTLRQGDLNFTVPVAYSLCASMGLGLFYYIMKG